MELAMTGKLPDSSRAAYGKLDRATIRKGMVKGAMTAHVFNG
jgi:hypothetical protein